MPDDEQRRSAESAESRNDSKPETPKSKAEKRVAMDTLADDNPLICRGTD